jgi:hypothetical protein
MACKGLILSFIFYFIGLLDSSVKNLECHGSVLGRSGKLLCDTMPKPASGFTKLSFHMHRERFTGGIENAAWSLITVKDNTVCNLIPKYI